jgi:ABC-type glycerol-3-phosphate transport system substrate-binding protein
MGVNCSVIVPEMRFSISAQSKNADAAWQLLRQFLLEDYQNEITYEFPIRKSSYDKLANESMERMFWIDDDGVKQYEDDIMYLGDQEVVVQPMTQEEVDYVKNFVGSLNMVYSANENVYNIITEEASAYFSGQKSAKEVADIIQSRVSIYVNENS